MAPLVNLLSSADDDTSIAAVRCLLVMVGASLLPRDLLSNILQALLAISTNLQRLHLVQQASLLLASVTRETEHLYRRCSLVTEIARNLLRADDEEVTLNALTTLKCLTDTSREDAIQSVVDAYVPQLAVPLLRHPNRDVRGMALLLVGNVATGTDNQMQELLRNGMVPALKLLVETAEGTILDDACWVVSNVCAGADYQGKCVVEIGLLPRLVTIAQRPELKKASQEAAIALANLCCRGNAGTIQAAVDVGVVKLFCAQLAEREEFQDALLSILKMGAKQNAGGENVFAEEMAGEGVVEALLELQAHEDLPTRTRACVMYNRFFPNYPSRWTSEAHFRAGPRKRREVVAVFSMLAHNATGGLRYPTCPLPRLPAELVEHCLE